MFSTIIFNRTKAFLRKTRIELELYHHNQPATQLQSELSNAIREGMVTTRRQSHGLPNEELRDGSEIDTPRNISSKGKNKRSERPISPALPAKRRKTRLEHLDNDGHNPSGRSVPTAPEQRRPTVQVVIAVDDENEGHKQEEQSLGSVARKSSSKEGRDGPGKGDYDKTPGVKPREQLAPSQDNKTNPNRAPYGQDDQMWVEASDLKVKPDGKTTGTAGMSTAPKATHLRFGNEENDVNALNVNEGRLRTDTLSVTVVEGSEESDAEDEAPEMITAYMGAEIAKARNKDADMAAERYVHLRISLPSSISDFTPTGNGQQLKRNVESGMIYSGSKPSSRRRP